MAPGDEGHADENRLRGVLGKYLKRLDNLTSETPISELFPEGEGFDDHGPGPAHHGEPNARRDRNPVPLDPNMQYTVGVPMGGLYELLSLARDRFRPWHLACDVRGHRRGAGVRRRGRGVVCRRGSRAGERRVPAIAASLLGDQDYHDLRGYTALTFTQAIASTLYFSARASGGRWVSQGLPRGGVPSLAARAAGGALPRHGFPRSPCRGDQGTLRAACARADSRTSSRGDPLEFPLAKRTSA